MPTVADTELQARLLKEILDANARRRKLEEEIRSVDQVSKRIIERAALQDIEEFKNRGGLQSQKHCLRD